MRTETEKAIDRLRSLEVERELTPREETRLIGLLRCAAEDGEEDPEPTPEPEAAADLVVCACGGPCEGYLGSAHPRPADLIYRGGSDWQCPRCFVIVLPAPEVSRETPEAASAVEPATDRPITEDENALMQHVSMWGSDGYPIHKLSKGGWTWEYRSIQGPPVVFKTKTEAVESFEAFLEVLRRALGDAAQRRAILERLIVAEAMRAPADVRTTAQLRGRDDIAGLCRMAVHCRRMAELEAQHEARPLYEAFVGEPAGAVDRFCAALVDAAPGPSAPGSFLHPVLLVTAWYPRVASV